MEPFTRLCGVAAPIEGRNIDTDQILPARFLKADRAKGYGQYFFHDARFDPGGREKPDFVLNREPYRHATIVVSDETWYAPDLKITVYSKHSDPRSGDRVFKLENLKREEPAAALFTVPSDYAVKDVLAELKAR